MNLLNWQNIPLTNPAIVIAAFQLDEYRSKLLKFTIQQLKKQNHPVYIALGILEHSKHKLSSLEKLVDQTLYIKGERNIFQKEAIYNAVAKKLPEKIDSIIFHDSDIFPIESDWINRTLKSLQKFPVVQTFTILHHLHKKETSQILENPFLDITADQILDGRNPRFPSLYYQLNAKMGKKANGGGSFALRKDFYELLPGIPWQGIFGSFATPLYYFNHLLEGEEYTPDYPPNIKYSTINEIKSKFGKARAGFVPRHLYHLWHGPVEKRNYLERKALAIQSGYFPEEDVFLNKTGGIELTKKGKRLEKILTNCFSVHLLRN